MWHFSAIVVPYLRLAYVQTNLTQVYIHSSIQSTRDVNIYDNVQTAISPNDT